MAEKEAPSAQAAGHLNIYQRIDQVRKKVDYIQKAAEVQGYKAVTHDHVTEKIRGALIDAGIVTTISYVLGSGKTVDTGTKTGKGVPFIRYEATYEVRFVNIDDPKDYVAVLFEAHAIDQGDKAPGKAESYAMKAVELKTFNIVSGEESDEDRPTDQVGGMPAKEEADWAAAIDGIAKVEDGKAISTQITQACNKYNDAEAYTRLKGHYTAKISALKKANGAAKPAAKKEASDGAVKH